MKKRRREDLKKTFMGAAGWLFADLLLALAMLFLVANTISLTKPPIVHAQAKHKTTPKPAPPPYAWSNITIASSLLLTETTS